MSKALKLLTLTLKYALCVIISTQTKIKQKGHIEMQKDKEIEEIKTISVTAIHTSNPKIMTQSLDISYPPRIGDKMNLFFDNSNGTCIVTDVLFQALPNKVYVPRYIYVDDAEELRTP
jgi:hypothetical protein